MKLTIAALALITAAVTGACAGPEVRGPFRNQYIDADTGKPIEGVVFLAVWYSTNVNPVDGGGESFYEAREAVSGPDGRVEIPALAGPIWRPFLSVRFHELAGDGYFSDEVRATPSGDRAYAGQTTSFMRQKTRKERCEHLRFAMPSVRENTLTIPRYLDLLQRERARCDG
jgi:hypothetical protein